MSWEPQPYSSKSSGINALISSQLDDYEGSGDETEEANNSLSNNDNRGFTRGRYYESSSYRDVDDRLSPFQRNNDLRNYSSPAPHSSSSSTSFTTAYQQRNNGDTRFNRSIDYNKTNFSSRFDNVNNSNSSRFYNDHYDSQFRRDHYNNSNINTNNISNNRNDYIRFSNQTSEPVQVNNFNENDQFNQQIQQQQSQQQSVENEEEDTYRPKPKESIPFLNSPEMSPTNSIENDEVDVIYEDENVDLKFKISELRQDEDDDEYIPEGIDSNQPLSPVDNDNRHDDQEDDDELLPFISSKSGPSRKEINSETVDRTQNLSLSQKAIPKNLNINYDNEDNKERLREIKIENNSDNNNSNNNGNLENNIDNSRDNIIAEPQINSIKEEQQSDDVNDAMCSDEQTTSREDEIDNLDNKENDEQQETDAKLNSVQKQEINEEEEEVCEETENNNLESQDEEEEELIEEEEIEEHIDEEEEEVLNESESCMNETEVDSELNVNNSEIIENSQFKEQQNHHHDDNDDDDHNVNEQNDECSLQVNSIEENNGVAKEININEMKNLNENNINEQQQQQHQQQKTFQENTVLTVEIKSTANNVIIIKKEINNDNNSNGKVKEKKEVTLNSVNDKTLNDEIKVENVKRNHCIGYGCDRFAIEAPDWDNEYCSNECAIRHCKDVFEAWVRQRQDELD